MDIYIYIYIGKKSSELYICDVYILMIIVSVTHWYGMCKCMRETIKRKKKIRKKLIVIFALTFNFMEGKM